MIADEAIHLEEQLSDKSKDETLTVKIVLPAFAYSPLENEAKANDVTLDRVIEEMGQKLK